MVQAIFERECDCETKDDIDICLSDDETENEQTIREEDIEIAQEPRVGEKITFGVYNSRCVALKPITDEDKENFDKLLPHLVQTKHISLCNILGACVTNNNTQIVMEKYKSNMKETIHNLLKDIPLNERVFWTRDICAGLSYLHGRAPRMIHNNLKLSNILFNDANQIVISDFWQGKTTDEIPIYVAPEVLEGEKPKTSSDIYSLGIIIWEIITREHPYANYETYEEFKEAVCNGERPVIPRWFPSSIRSIITDCWKANPSSRPSAFNLLTRYAECMNEFQELTESQVLSRIDNFIQDEHGKTFWLNNFPTKVAVPWEEFSAAFCAELNVEVLEEELEDDAPPERFGYSSSYLLDRYGSVHEGRRERVNRILSDRTQNTVITSLSGFFSGLSPEERKPRETLATLYGLKVLLNAEVNETVFVEQFGETLARTGPLKQPEGQRDYFSRLLDLISWPCFCGELPTLSAQTLLRTRTTGTFLVRFSNTTTGSYTLSFVDEFNNIWHRRINRTPDGNYKHQGLDTEYPHVHMFIDDFCKNAAYNTRPLERRTFSWLSHLAPPTETFTASGYAIFED